MNTTNTYDKMQLQRDLMDCWLTALDNPMRSRVIIELDEEDETNAWTDRDGNKHALNKYIMIDGSDGDGHLFDLQDLRDELEHLFRKKVDLLTLHENMRKLFRNNIERDAIFV